jgi:putative FmdB family regulatory protein
MPVYEYQCEKCGKVIEMLQKVDGVIPECHGRPMKKIISKGSFILKGKGWYATDYKDKPKETKSS